AGAPGGDSLEQQLQALQSLYSQRSVLYSENHPDMRSLRKQISLMQKEVAQARNDLASAKPVDSNDPTLGVELRLIAQKMAALDQSIALTIKQRAELVKSVASLQDMIAKSPEIGAALLSLERKRDALQKSADDISAKLTQ